MHSGDHCAVWDCDKKSKSFFLTHGILRFYSLKNKQDVLSWARSLNRDKFKVILTTKVCSNHFVQGYRAG